VKLIKTVCFQRNIKGYTEQTDLQIYVTWSNGCQVFIINQPSDGDRSEENIRRTGQWFLTPETACLFVERFKLSFGADTELDFTDIVEYTEESFETLLNDKTSDGKKWRIVVKEMAETTKMIEMGHVRLASTGRFGVRVNRATRFDQMPFLTSFTPPNGPDIYESYRTAMVVGIGLSTINYENDWANNIRLMFTNPTVIVECLEGEEWVEYGFFPFVSIDHTLVFNHDFTTQTVTRLG
jgi:hypothetical protein